MQQPCNPVRRVREIALALYDSGLYRQSAIPTSVIKMQVRFRGKSETPPPYPQAPIMICGTEADTFSNIALLYVLLLLVSGVIRVSMPKSEAVQVSMLIYEVIQVPGLNSRVINVSMPESGLIQVSEPTSGSRYQGIYIEIRNKV